MVLIIVPEAVLLCGEMPPEVRDYISPNVWYEIVNSVVMADGDSNVLACLVEATVCLCCVFPCIFLCHPCIAKIFMDQKRTDKLNLLNRMYFFGQPVLSTTDSGGILVNTDFISVAQSQPRVAVAYLNPATIEVVPSPIYQQNSSVVRTMAVTVPNSAQVGTVLDVETPDGRRVNVTVPPSVKPGETMNVEY